MENSNVKSRDAAEPPPLLTDSSCVDEHSVGVVVRRCRGMSAEAARACVRVCDDVRVDERRMEKRERVRVREREGERACVVVRMPNRRS